MTARRKKQGAISVVGAGPGQPDLLTGAALAAIAAAEAVVVDPAVPGEILALLREDCERVEAPEVPATAAAAVAAARDGRQVVVLVPGDALTAELGLATALAAGKAKLRLTVVPGLALEMVAPAYAGIALSSARTSATVSASLEADWAGLAAAGGSVVLTLPLGIVGKAAAALLEHGRRGDAPVAVTVAGATARQRTVVATLDSVEAEAAHLARTVTSADSCVLVVGDGVKQRDKLSWWESRPLFGWSVLVPRTREQGSSLSATLRELGAEPVEVPTIAVEPPRTQAPMERALRGLVGGRYAWVAFTSVNAVKAVREKLEESGLDARAFAGVKVAAVGDATAAALVAFGLRPDLVPGSQQSSEGLLEMWPDRDDQLDVLERVLLPRADIATETLAAGLKAKGWSIDDITAYRTVRATPPPAPVREALKSGRIDAVLFTSSSTVRNLLGIAGKPHESTVIGVIGPATAATATELGLRVDVQASSASVEVLARDLADLALVRRAEQLASPAPKETPKKPARSRRAR